MFCREQVAQFLDVADDIRARGAELVLVSTGAPYFAKAFKEDRNIQVPLVTDPSGKLYENAEWSKSVGSTFSRKTLKNSKRALAGGFKQGRTQGRPFQQGGVLVVRPDQSVAYRYASEVAGDHPDPAEALAAL